MHAHELEQALVPQDGETLVFDTNPVLNERVTHYCPGCHHGIAHRLVSEVLHELGVADRTILVASVGCATFTYDYFNVDGLEAPHGRACAVATGVRRARPESVVFTYQGDGDMGAIGLAESIHAANRGELITGIFINNTVYGMTGGQYSGTTPEERITTTSRYGHIEEGFDICAVAKAAGARYVARASTENPQQLKNLIRDGIKKQGFACIEAISPCPTHFGRNNGMRSPAALMRWVNENSVTPAQAVAMSEEELAGKLVMGLICDRPGEDYSTKYQHVIEKAQSEVKK